MKFALTFLEKNNHSNRVIVFFGAFESKFYNFRYFNQIFHFVWNITITRFAHFDAPVEKSENEQKHQTQHTKLLPYCN